MQVNCFPISSPLYKYSTLPPFRTQSHRVNFIIPYLFVILQQFTVLIQNSFSPWPFPNTSVSEKWNVIYTLYIIYIIMKTIFYEWAQRKIHTFVPPCNILYIKHIHSLVYWDHACFSSVPGTSHFYCQNIWKGQKIIIWKSHISGVQMPTSV